MPGVLNRIGLAELSRQELNKDFGRLNRYFTGYATQDDITVISCPDIKAFYNSLRERFDSFAKALDELAEDFSSEGEDLAQRLRGARINSLFASKSLMTRKLCEYNEKILGFDEWGEDSSSSEGPQSTAPGGYVFFVADYPSSTQPNEEETDESATLLRPGYGFGHRQD